MTEAPQYKLRNKIKFSNEYQKHPDGWEESTLLEVLVCNIDELSKPFLEYDTTFKNGGRYPLPRKGKFMILLLLSKSGHLWTTIRRHTPRKEAYYTLCIGKQFDCIITEVKDEHRL